MDTVIARASHILRARQEVEILKLSASTGSAALKLTGNEFSNTMTGNRGDNLLRGLDGADVLDGSVGADTLVGGQGDDVFVFSTSVGAGNIDRITDFRSVGAGNDDTIRLDADIFAMLSPSALSSSAFKDRSRGTVDFDDRIIYDRATGALFYDADGAGGRSAVQFAELSNRALISHLDFVVA